MKSTPPLEPPLIATCPPAAYLLFTRNWLVVESINHCKGIRSKRDLRCSDEIIEYINLVKKMSAQIWKLINTTNFSLLRPTYVPILAELAYNHSVSNVPCNRQYCLTSSANIGHGEDSSIFLKESKDRRAEKWVDRYAETAIALSK